MNNIIRNKLFVIISLFIIILCFSVTSVFASTDIEEVTFNWNVKNKDITIKLPSGYGTEYTYFYIMSDAFNSEKVNHYVYMGNSPFYFDGNKILCDGGFVTAYYTYLQTKTYIDYSVVSYSDGLALDVGSASTINSVKITRYSDSVVVGDDFVNPNNIQYSTHNICEKSTNDVVFQVAPQEGALATTISSMDFSQVLQEILEMLPIILVVVIGLLCLRKAIQLLYKMLHQA